MSGALQPADHAKEPIAIIGSGCRFPGHASSPSKLWDLLKNPRDLMTPIPPERFNAKGFYHPDGQFHGHSNVKGSYHLHEEGVERRFDAHFFGINPVEANVLDPQMRLLLETVYEAVEDAGQTLDALQGSNTAVFAGLMSLDYETVMYRDPDSIGTYHVTGTARSLLSNRISYFFDWHGPSMTIDTACSSSLVALHQAVQVLRSGESQVAVAAGTNLILDPQYYVSESKLQMLSPDGRSRMWDAGVNGYARGDGIAAVILKPLSKAIADGDCIDCVIRETGLNQDGKTQGITLPSAMAQAKLIRDCYSRVGLDISNPANRPQYFEAHGTGTPAGDPIEAEAISTAFFGEGVSGTHDTLYVGSIKTVVGHTEGTAGLAAIMKVALALQNSTVPPNLLFERLNPRIEPFYKHLEVPTSAKPWPEVSGTRRASVNRRVPATPSSMFSSGSLTYPSFGFGGANAHAILESYTPLDTQVGSGNTTSVFTPFVFSAASEKSLVAYITTFIKYLKEHQESVNLRDLAYSLHTRRSRLQYATSTASLSIEGLCSKLEQKLKTAGNDSEKPVGRRADSDLNSRSARILGVFTGQGAQWARMGVELISSSDAARKIVQRLEARLSQLPLVDRPAWSLIDELQKDSSSSRITEATFSQPLCTAIQIVLVDLLHAAGIKFSALVGHSSGEIGAAYASGLISAESAICIAYYRGLHTRLATGGAMMAVGTSAEDAQELCDDPLFEGRIAIAAVNSSASVTLSGDEDAIEEARQIFVDENKFARRLKVDKAYHSRHMIPCSEVYIQSLKTLHIEIRPQSGGVWFSSVCGDEAAESRSRLQDAYWDANMVSPVLFKQAIEKACTVEGPFDLCIEIGPHPALKGPALQTIQDVCTQDAAYTGLLERGKNDIEAFGDGLGYIWTCLGKGQVNLQATDELLSNSSPVKLVKGLPTYAWDHENEYWHESRYARAIRMRPDAAHELLGHLTPDSSDHEMRWRNVLRPQEISWLKGHQLQDQIVLPAAAYVVLAFEASMALYKASVPSLVEIVDLDIGQALTFDNETASIETIFSMSDIRQDGNKMHASFKYYSTPMIRAGASLSLMASGTVHLTLDDPSAVALPARNPREPNLLSVDTAEFYSSLQQLDYQYSGDFYALSKLERKLGAATGVITDVEDTSLLVHPAMLDAAFQSVLLSHSAPYDGRLWAMHVPRRIQCASINPYLCANKTTHVLPFDATQPHDQQTITGDVSVYPGDLEHAMIQVQGLECVPFSRATEHDDKEVFSTTHWDLLSPSVEKVTFDGRATPEQYQLSLLLERLCYQYLANLERSIPDDHCSRSEGPYKNFFKFARHFCESADNGKLSYWQADWADDTLDELLRLSEPYADAVDLRLLNALGPSFPAIVMGETTPVEIGMQDNLLANFYSNGLGNAEYTNYLTRTVKQLTHRYPHLSILEVGAGTAGATKGIMKEVTDFESYTFTDISSGFFDQAKEMLAPQSERMTFKVLDIGRDPRSQGFADGTYDLIVASLVLHATPFLKDTMRNVRRLLKPGGYLVLLEGTNNDAARIGTIFGAFTGWWLGAEDGRVLTPQVTVPEWDRLLRESGFSGCDAVTPDHDPITMPMSLIVSQALNEKVAFLREPLASPIEMFSSGLIISDLVIVGGRTLSTCRLEGHLRRWLERYSGNVKTVRALDELSSVQLTADTTVLSLADLDEATFKNLSDSKWNALKTMLQSAGTVLWVTEGRRSRNPHANMTVGLVHTALKEIPALSMQFLDFEDSRNIDARTIAEALLRFKAGLMWASDESMLLSVEPELILDRDGQTSIPRLIKVQAMNDRYNSSRRPILEQSHAEVDIVRLEISGPGFSLRRERNDFNFRPTSLTRLHTTHSLLYSVKIENFGSMFLGLGRHVETGTQMVFLSEHQSSLIEPSAQLTVPCKVPDGLEADFLSIAALRLISLSVMSRLNRSEILLVHEPSHACAAILEKDAAARGIIVKFTTTKKPCGDGWLLIHPRASMRSISGLLGQVSAFVDFSNHEDERTVAIIRAHLRVSCIWEDMSSIFSRSSWVKPAADTHAIRYRLKAVAGLAAQDVSDSDISMASPDTVELSQLTDTEDSFSSQSIVSWTTSSVTLTKVEPIDSRLRFSDSKTYWLAGLTGGLGLSLCEWMVRHGAKYIVITSRNPKVDEGWIERMAAAGAVVKIYANDVTDRAQVVGLHKDICDTLPPIAGVAQGAMVLDDTPIRNMNKESMLKVTRPKVEGSIHLNDLFQEDTLDFFIFFSSVTVVIGNIGQSNYTTANAFMTSLARQRRDRGLAASIINIGPVLGVGYIAQKDLDRTAAFERSGAYVYLAEQDVHQLFGEAVAAGRPFSSLPIEITTGVRRISAAEEFKPLWASDPMMSHFVKNSESSGAGLNDSKSKVSLKTQLAEAKNEEQIYHTVKNALLPKLAGLFQFDIGKLEQADLATFRLDEIGIDSLLAVEIRTWFMKTLEVNIPVLKILSGVSAGALIDEAVAVLAPRLLAAEGSTEPTDLLEQAPEIEVSTPNSGETASLSDQTSEDTEVSSGDSEILNPNTTGTTPFIDLDDPIKGLPLLPVPERTVELSFSQSMFWFVAAYLDDKTGLNHTGSLRITGKLRSQDFKAAIEAIGQRHESLRTCFSLVDGQPSQSIMETSLLHLEHRQISHEREVHDAVWELEHHVFDLEQGETVRVLLLSRSLTEHYFLLGSHSLVMDGLSSQVFIKDLLQLYDHQPLQPAPLQYPDYSQKQHQEFLAGKYENELRYWRSEYPDFPPQLSVLRVSTTVTHPVLKTYENTRVDLKIKPDVKSQIQSVCRRCKVTPFHFYFTTFRALLARFSDIQDVSIGIGDANRLEDRLLESIGPYVNLLPLRFRNDAGRNFEEVLQETRSKTYAALANSRVPFQLLLDQLKVPRSATCTPIFQAFIDYRQGQKMKENWGDNHVELISFQASHTPYDLALDIIDDPQGECLLMLQTRKDIYNQDDTAFLLKSYEMLLKSFAQESSVALSQPNIFQQADIDRAMQFGQGPIYDSRWPETIVHRVQQLAESQPAISAITSAGGVSTTYSELSSKSSSIAVALHQAGVGPGSRIAILQEPTADWVASILAVMHIGAIYLPLDLTTPMARLSVIANDCQPSVVLVDDDTQHLAGELGMRNLRPINVSVVKDTGVCIPIAATADSIAMILYTSGSSGTPKGIALKHEGLRNWIEPAAEQYGLGAETVLQQSASSFDMSFTQIFIALCFGGNLVLLGRCHRGDAQAISELIVSKDVTFTCATPSEYFSWLKYGNDDPLRTSCWKRALCAGEPVVESLLQQFASLGKPDLRFFNSYGPTEISLVATATELPYEPQNKKPYDSIDAGYTLPNYSVYVLGDGLKPVPPGVQGEIYIGGAGVAAGYLNNPGLTGERFVPDHLASAHFISKGWNVMHRTGDLGRWRREDGALLIEGRISGDTQIKLRGLRIDMRDIESAMIEAAMGSLSEVVVSVRRRSPQSPEFLVAHVKFNPKHPKVKEEHILGTILASLSLPQYMLPSVVLRLDQMPMTSSGKLDRKAVASLALPDVSVDQDLSSNFTESERRLKDIWTDVISKEVINIHHITPSSDFFHVGGTSLLLLSLQAHLKRSFNIKLPLVQMFESSTLAAMALRIESEKTPEMENFDWEEETKISPATLALEKRGSQVHYGPKTVVLTGVTGFLGQELLKGLLDDDTISRVHCIGVRNFDRLPRSLRHEKVLLYQGDLTLPRLGLSEEIVSRIFKEADRIIHNGADVSHLKTFQSLRTANLQATKELIEMSLPRLIPFHYVSTAGVGTYSGLDEFREVSATPHPPPTDGFDGYTASKWASERYLEKVAEHCRWPVWIHRPSSVKRADIPDLDLMQNLLKYCKLMHAVPVSTNLRGELDLVTPATVVRSMIGELHNENPGPGWVRFLHQAGNVKLALDDMKTFMERELEGPVKELPIDQWARKAGELGLHEVLVAFFENVVNLRVITYPKLIKGQA
ncbi:hypothetical protein DL764_000394 [Monosporascus ibericus]|uniref:Uncharacterized protein n=1 Tax=Monosporascus ibericus TaxID=155417 RepID=A0A4Q4TVD8_9PEZI|nr:hypothetical protein DL764_000394 [Monosporascus ibericus]